MKNHFRHIVLRMFFIIIFSLSFLLNLHYYLLQNDGVAFNEKETIKDVNDSIDEMKSEIVSSFFILHPRDKETA